jgi:hypothetical protein
MEKEVDATIRAARKGGSDLADADRLLKEATAIEASMDAPSGPVEPIKPSFELYGEFLLDQGRTKEAAAQFEQSLARTPNRRLSVQGLQRSTPKTSTNAGR